MSPAAHHLLEAAEIRAFLEAELEHRSPVWLRDAFNHADAVCRVRAAQLLDVGHPDTLRLFFGKALAA